MASIGELKVNISFNDVSRQLREAAEVFIEMADKLDKSTETILNNDDPTPYIMGGHPYYGPRNKR